MELQDAALAELQNSKRGLTVEQLEKRLNSPQGLLLIALHQLRKENLVEFLQDGRWKALPAHT